MSMDIQCLQYSLENVHPCRPPRGKHYVDELLRASQLPEDLMMEWIEENWQSYAYRHVLGILVMTLSSVLSNKKLREASVALDRIYEKENSEDSKLAKLLSNRLRDDNSAKLTSLFPKGLRKPS